MGARTAVRNHGLRHGAPSSRSAQRRRSTACVARTWWSLGTLWHVGCILSSQPRMATREEEKRRCPLGFGSMFRDNPQLFDHPKCTVQVPVANASLHLVWQTSFTSREISQFYRRLFSYQARSRRRLLLTTMALPNACAAWNGGAVGRNLSWAPDRVMPCLLKLLAQWPSHRDALAEVIVKLPAPSTWVVRTHPAIRTALPRITYQSELSDELAHLQRNVWMPLCLCTRRRQRFVRCTCSISSGRLSNRRRARGMRMPSIRGGSYNVGKRR